MEESDKSTGYIAMFDDNVLLIQMDWDCLSSNKAPLDDWKGLDNDKINMHVNKTKDEMLDPF